MEAFDKNHQWIEQVLTIVISFRFRMLDKGDTIEVYELFLYILMIFCLY